MIGSSNINRITLAVNIVAAVTTISLGIYAARPWGDNYAYQDPMGYVGLVGFLLWAVSPYVALAGMFRIIKAGRRRSWVRLIGSLIVAGFGAFVIVDTTFVHIDAQGGLVFLFAPLYQWFGVGIIAIICSVMKGPPKQPVS